MNASPSCLRSHSSDDVGSDDQFFFQKLLAALGVHRLQVLLSNRMQNQAEQLVLELLRKHRWHFSPKPARGQLPTSPTVLPNSMPEDPGSHIGAMGFWPLLDATSEGDFFMQCVSRVLRRAFSDDSCDSPQPYTELIDQAHLDCIKLFATAKLQAMRNNPASAEQNAAWVRDIGGGCGSLSARKPDQADILQA